MKSVDAISCGELTGNLVLPHAGRAVRMTKAFQGKGFIPGKKGHHFGCRTIEQVRREKGESQCRAPGSVIQTPVHPTPSYSFLRAKVKDGQQKTQMKIRRIGELEFKALQLQQEGG